MSSFSVRVIDHLAENGTINPDDKELYSYGLHQGILMIANLLTTMAIGIVFGMLWQSVIFMAAYMPLRSFAGGYHARTQLLCYIYSIILTITVLSAIKYIPWTSLYCLITTIVACTVIMFLAPIEDKNKPLDSVEVLVYKKRTTYILCVEIIMILVLLASKLLQVSVSISVSLLALSVMLVLGKFSNIRYMSKYSDNELSS